MIKSAHKNAKKNQRGQAMVEYLLLIGVIVGVLGVFKKVMIERDKSVVGMILKGIQCQVDVNSACGGASKMDQAHRGGRPTYGNYYQKGSVKVD